MLTDLLWILDLFETTSVNVPDAMACQWLWNCLACALRSDFPPPVQICSRQRTLFKTAGPELIALCQG